MDTMDIDNYTHRIQQLEEEELEFKASPELYVELLAFYLFQDNLIDAKSLVQRIPAEHKADNKELAQLELLLNTLSTNNSAEFFKNVNFGWSDLTRDIIKNLKEKTMDDVLKLVSHAYTSILEKNLLHMTQLSREDLKNVCQNLGWSYEEDNQQVVILPTPRIDAYSSVGNSKQQLFKLTEFVTFLEN